MARHFQACRISRKGNVLFPDELIIANRAKKKKEAEPKVILAEPLFWSGDYKVNIIFFT